MKKDLYPHPTQPIVRDERGELRFRGNAIVRGLVGRDGGDPDALVKLVDAPADDHVQFFQLLGMPIADPRFDSIRPGLSAHVDERRRTRRYDPHPMQPVHEDAHGTYRFRKNLIVDALLDRDAERGRVYPDFPARSDGGMNWIATQDFSREDEEQIAQLVGYSVSGYQGLDYVSDASAARARALAAALLSPRRRA